MNGDPNDDAPVLVAILFLAVVLALALIGIAYALGRFVSFVNP